MISCIYSADDVTVSYVKGLTRQLGGGGRGGGGGHIKWPGTLCLACACDMAWIIES